MDEKDYESILLVKPEVFVYKIPPKQSNRGYKAADWNLTSPDWSGRLRIITKGKKCIIKLEDKSGELFAACPVAEYPSPSVEQVVDSSRYFVLRIQDDSGRSAFVGIGFTDRSDSFDLNVALQDHFKWVKQSETLAQNNGKEDDVPKLDLAFKEGQTIKIKNMNFSKKDRPGKAKPEGGGTAATGLIGLLPPPPGAGQIPLLRPPPAHAYSITTGTQPRSTAAVTTTSDGERPPETSLSDEALLAELDSIQLSSSAAKPSAGGDSAGQEKSAQGDAAASSWVQF